MKLQVIKEIQISRYMTIYGQTLGVFKHENRECICNGEKTKLHALNQNCSFLNLAYVVLWREFRHKLRHYDVKMM